ncbi:hypothetical protein ACFLRA_02720 [Bdellovibrionota bacterium]
MKHLGIAALVLSIIFGISGCGHKEQRYKGTYPTSFGIGHPAIKVEATFWKETTTETESGEPVTSWEEHTVALVDDEENDWVKFGNLISPDDDLKIDELERIVAVEYLRHTVGFVNVEPLQQNDMYRLYFPAGSRMVKLGARVPGSGHWYDSRFEPMDEPAISYMNDEDHDQCNDHITFDVFGIFKKMSLLAEFIFHYEFVSPGAETNQEAVDNCKLGLESLIITDLFNPNSADFPPYPPEGEEEFPEGEHPLQNLYQLWYLFFYNRDLEGNWVDPDDEVTPRLDPYKLKSIDLHVQVAGVKKFRANW